jgi:ABC-type iron transport system FetAB ATPase subunit
MSNRTSGRERLSNIDKCCYDLHNKEKVKSFIPTMSSIDVIEDVMLSTSVPDRGRSRILIGAYGKGKSHIVLMLMSLLYRKDMSMFKTLLDKISQQNQELYRFITNYVASDKKLLPIIISGSSTSITQSFLSALQKR